MALFQPMKVRSIRFTVNDLSRLWLDYYGHRELSIPFCFVCRLRRQPVQRSQDYYQRNITLVTKETLTLFRAATKLTVPLKTPGNCWCAMFSLHR
jgi:hypothetical protein